MELARTNDIIARAYATQGDVNSGDVIFQTTVSVAIVKRPFMKTVERELNQAVDLVVSDFHFVSLSLSLS